MKKSVLAVVIACICAIAALGVVGCSSSQESSSSSSKESFSSVGEQSVKQATDEVKPVYILAVGNDSRYQTSEDEKGLKPDDPSFSDTMLLMYLDPEKNYISILSIPRDTACDINGQPEKINAVHYAFGNDMMVSYVEGMFGIKIPYYFDLKFVDFAALVDAVGGMQVDVPIGLTGGDIISGDDITLEAGENNLNGNEALMLVRQRKLYSGNGEAIRQMITRNLVATTIQNLANRPASEAPALAHALETHSVSNMPEDLLTAYIATYMENTGDINFNLGTTNYEGGIDDSGEWRVPADTELYAQEKTAMEEGTPLSDLVANPSVG